MTRAVRSSAFLLVLFAAAALLWRYHASSDESGDSLELATPISTGDSSPSGWLFNVFGDANRAGFESLTGEPTGLRVNIERAATPELWHIQLRRPRLALDNHTLYELSFQARADGQRRISYGVNTHEFRNIGLFREIPIDATWREFRESFTPETADLRAELHFDVGASPVGVELRDVALRRVSDGALIEPGHLLETNLYTLHLSIHHGQVPAPAADGGGIEPFGNGYLLATGSGEIYLIERDRRGVTTTPTSLRVPLNADDFARSAGSRGANTRWFRVTDILVQHLPDRRIRLFAAHHYWRRAQSCSVLRVSVAELDGDALLSSVGTSWKTLFETSPCLALKDRNHPFSGHQAGGRLQLVDSGRLLMSVGDQEYDGLASDDMLPQEPAASYGKTLIVDIATGDAQVFTLGHRNPQGLAIGTDGTIWSTEHGPRGGDELNRLERGGNYGWPLETYGTDYGSFTWPFRPSPAQGTSLRRPVYAWVPSVGLSNLVEVTTDRLERWKGDWVIGSLNGHTLFRTHVEDRRVIFVEPIEVDGPIRDLCFGSDGTLALWMDEGGTMAFLEPAEESSQHVPSSER